MYLNGWIAVFQLLFSLVLCVPASLVSDPPVSIPDLPENLYDGLKCYFGYNSISCDPNDDDCTADDCFPQAPMFVTIYLVFNQLYNLLILLLIKYGSSNLLWLALTLMVPLGNVAFTLPFVPEHTGLHATDIVGLIMICGGLGIYRFAQTVYEDYYGKAETFPLTAADLRDDKSILSPFLADEDSYGQARQHSTSKSMSKHMPESIAEEAEGTDEL